MFDKTGTLTKGVFNVTDILPANGFSKEQVLEYAVQAESFSNHPIAKSILSAYEKKLTNQLSLITRKFPDMESVPWQERRKFMPAI